MDDNAVPAQGPPSLEDRSFRAVLVPHRSLSPAGFLLLMSLLGAVSFVAGMAFLLAGAWPVLGFFGLDLAVVYVAFKLNYRSGRLYETVEVNPAALTITRVQPSGRQEAFTFATAWVRVELREAHDGRTELKLRHHARELLFGRFLTDDERRDFSHALRAAVPRARGGIRI